MGAAQGFAVGMFNHVAHRISYNKTVKVLKKLHDFVKSNPKVLSTLAYYSGYSEVETLELLKYGKGPKTIVKKLDKNTYGETNPNGKEIYISDALAKGLEIAKLKDTINGTSFNLAVTALHEFVHWGRIQNGLASVFESYEYGKGFEIYAFGEDINNNNALEYAKKFNWSF